MTNEQPLSEQLREALALTIITAYVHGWSDKAKGREPATQYDPEDVIEKADPDNSVLAIVEKIAVEALKRYEDCPVVQTASIAKEIAHRLVYGEEDMLT